MYHTIEFAAKIKTDLAVPGQARLEKIIIQKGTRLKAEIRPGIKETELGPIEVADLYLEDGSTAHRVHFASFRFVEE